MGPVFAVVVVDGAFGATGAVSGTVTRGARGGTPEGDGRGGAVGRAARSLGVEGRYTGETAVDAGTLSAVGGMLFTPEELFAAGVSGGDVSGASTPPPCRGVAAPSVGGSVSGAPTPFSLQAPTKEA